MTEQEKLSFAVGILFSPDSAEVYYDVAGTDRPSIEIRPSGGGELILRRRQGVMPEVTLHIVAPQQLAGLHLSTAASFGSAIGCAVRLGEIWQSFYQDRHD